MGKFNLDGGLGILGGEMGRGDCGLSAKQTFGMWRGELVRVLGQILQCVLDKMGTRASWRRDGGHN